MLNLKERYQQEIIPALQKKFGYKNVMEMPRIIKVVVNEGVGEATASGKELDVAAAELALITGQKPLITLAKKAIAAFKLKAKMPIGCKVTLRGQRMYDFLDKLINVCLPKIRDFRGVPEKSFDGRGNYSLGIKDQLIFPEVDQNKVDKTRGMDITINTSARTDAEARYLLELMGMPFRRV